MSIADKLAELVTIRSNIRTALEDQGVSASDHNFANFAVDIASISGGGSGESAVIIASACGANATVTATKGQETFTATADAAGVANVFVASTGTYTVSSTGTATTKAVVVSAMYELYNVKLSGGEEIIQEAKFYTDFDNRYSNLNEVSGYSITPQYTPSYSAGTRKFLYTSGNRFTFSNDFLNVVKTSNGDMTIITLFKLTTPFTSDKGSRLFDFYNQAQTRVQGVTIYGNTVRGMNNDGATTVSTITTGDWVVIAVRKHSGATSKDVSVYSGGSLTNTSVADTETYGLARFLFSGDYGYVQGNCAGLVLLDRFITNDELTEASIYLLEEFS